ncbi:PadR family transcriptional regulator [Streptomyces sp. NPDC096094]|uniref:PadR family transcriptional regulator n=1 Tax=Streptomyces sp. NPDC096094 TaxID=3366073 RepID=UPI003830AC63
MSIPYVLLGILGTGPQHGYELKRQHDARFPEARPLAYGQVYTTLQRLARDGHIEVLDTRAIGAPERTRYCVTDSGVKKLRLWLAESIPPAPFVTNEIFAKLVVALLSGDRTAAAGMLSRQRDAHKSRVEELVARRQAVQSSPAAALSLDYALDHLAADLRWLETVAEVLADLGEEIGNADQHHS